MSLGSSLLWLNTNQPGGFFPLSQHLFWQSLHLWLVLESLAAVSSWKECPPWDMVNSSIHKSSCPPPSSLQQCTRSLQDTCATLGITYWVAWRRARYSLSWGMEEARSCCSWSTSEEEFIHLVLYFLLEHNPASCLLQGPILSTYAVCWLSFLP